MISLTSQEIIDRIGELASELTPPSEIAVLLGIDPDRLRAELSIKDSPARQAYYRGKARTANVLRKIELEFARVGSPLAVQLTGSYLRDMTADEDF
ncbi:hypothetical protein IMSAGC008_00183 [Muribaculaceae bacterium]|nr:hypothetical protein IMSAGC008_00183 [Muribaculaceae bacterium]